STCQLSNRYSPMLESKVTNNTARRLVASVRSEHYSCDSTCEDQLLHCRRSLHIVRSTKLASSSSLEFTSAQSTVSDESNPIQITALSPRHSESPIPRLGPRVPGLCDLPVARVGPVV